MGKDERADQGVAEPQSPLCLECQTVGLARPARIGFTLYLPTGDQRIHLCGTHFNRLQKELNAGAQEWNRLNGSPIVLPGRGIVGPN